jgi:hypothetical protein
MNSNFLYPTAIATSNLAFNTWKYSNNTLYVLGSNVGIGVSNANENLAVTGNMSLSNYGKITLWTSNDFLGIGLSNPRVLLDATPGNLAAKNFQRLTQSTDSSNQLTITINWDNAYNAGNQYTIVFDTIQQISNGVSTGFKTQRHSIGLSNQTMLWETSANAYGNAPAYTTLFWDVLSSTTKSVTLRSYTNWVTSGVMAHSFTVDIIQAPNTTNIGSVWVS